MSLHSLRRSAHSALPAAAALLIFLHLFLIYTFGSAAANNIGVPVLFIVGLPLVIATVKQAQRGQFATDAIASIAIITAMAMYQPLPGLIIVLMQSGGEALERMAERRAGHELSLLENAAPRTARRWDGSEWADVPVDLVLPNERLLIPPGDIVPVDGTVIEGESDVDTAAITGEPLPLQASPGSVLLSGYVNGSSALIIHATARAADSNYARIVTLVKSAQEKKAPIQRVADQYAVWFTPLVVLFALATYLLTRDMQRVLAVLVIATPCPLLLAPPIAIMGGINSGARMRTLFRDGRALESLASVHAVVFDKTGTLTVGRPTVTDIVSTAGVSSDALMSLVAGLEMHSSHPLAGEIVSYVRRRGIPAGTVSASREEPGRGIQGVVNGVDIAVGSRSFIVDYTGAPIGDTFEHCNGRREFRSWISHDSQVAGFVRYSDVARPDLNVVLHRLRRLGVRHMEILSGDESEAVTHLASGIDVDAAHARLLPSDKLDHIERVKREYGMTAMVGDGTNDAPALAAAHVGIAITPRGGGIAADTADIVLLGDDLTRLPDAVLLAQRTIHIARQSIVAGLTLSAIGIVFAALGLLAPVPAAATQEIIDVLVILNVLRVIRPMAPAPQLLL